MYLNLCHLLRFPIPNSLRFVLQLHILLLLTQIALNSPVKKGKEKGVLRLKRDQGEVRINPRESRKRQPHYDDVIVESPKAPNSLEEDNNVLPSPQKNEIDVGYKSKKQLILDANRSGNRKPSYKDPQANKHHNKLDVAKWKKRLPKKEKEYDIEKTKRQHEKWKRALEEEKVYVKSQNGFAIRHISRVPQPAYPVGDEAPSGLAEDQNRHGDDDDEYEETFSTQREAFEKMLDDHRKHPKRTKDSQDEDKYIILSYDYLNKKYSIVEIEDDDDSHSRNKHK